MKTVKTSVEKRSKQQFSTNYKLTITNVADNTNNRYGPNIDNKYIIIIYYYGAK